VQEISITANELIDRILAPDFAGRVTILDSCGIGHLGSHLLIAGIDPVETTELSPNDAGETLQILDKKLSSDLAAIFTISYDFGRKLLCKQDSPKQSGHSDEPDVFITQFDTLVVHDYATGKTFLSGNQYKFDVTTQTLKSDILNIRSEISNPTSSVTSNFTESEYVAATEFIKERIRSGDTYQTNLTQQLTAKLADDLKPEIIFKRLRHNHPAPFAAFIPRFDSTVVSASPERFFKVEAAIKGGKTTARERAEGRTITTSPIKGTRPRGGTAEKDKQLRQDLLTSPKDRAENTMIVDLLRNDLGRICEYGSVQVEKLYEIEEHPTLYHLVSTVSGTLRKVIKPSDILRALFPCGSITGAPKISTMSIIDDIETADRGLSMGAIGYYLPANKFGLPATLELSVAIRTMVIRGKTATFNVGGGIVIDSDPKSEYDESLTKAKALMDAIGGKLSF